VVVESLIDVESLYLLATTLKFYGGTDIQYGNSRIHLNVDNPTFYNLNRTFDSLDNLKGLILIGTNPRFEASLLNTNLRKQQMARALPYMLVGNAVATKFKYSHEGNSLKVLNALIENKNNNFQKYYSLENSSIFLGVESLKNKNALVLQNITRFLGKKLYSKTRKGERLGLLHANTTSLAFANLGIDAGVRSVLHLTDVQDKKFNNLFVVQPFEVSAKK
jgi:NADH-quinone oxidoreductase subunit G